MSDEKDADLSLVPFQTSLGVGVAALGVASMIALGLTTGSPVAVVSSAVVFALLFALF